MQQKAIPPYIDLVSIYVLFLEHTCSCWELELFAYPKESSEVAPVPSRGVEHVRGKNTVDNTDDVAVRRVSYMN